MKGDKPEGDYLYGYKIKVYSPDGEELSHCNVRMERISNDVRVAIPYRKLAGIVRYGVRKHLGIALTPRPDHKRS